MAAAEAFSKLKQAGSGVVTTTFVLMECGNAAARRPYRSAVDRLRQQLEASNSAIVAGDDDWQEAWTAYSRGDPGGPGIVDHVSFLVMRRLGIRDAFTNDRHFLAAGFNTLF